MFCEENPMMSFKQYNRRQQKTLEEYYKGDVPMIVKL